MEIFRGEGGRRGIERLLKEINYVIIRRPLGESWEGNVSFGNVSLDLDRIKERFL